MIDRITVRGARQHNLRDIHLAIPRNSFTVVTGLSGSGKSSLAFDTIYAEGQRRYVETLSPYARQFLDQMERPDVDSIDGLSPALSIEQKTTSRSPRSTVGTITEIYDYLRLLYSSIGKPHCPNCGAPIYRQTTDQIVAPHSRRADGPPRDDPRAGRARPQGRVQKGIRALRADGLRARPRRRRNVRARRRDHARPPPQPHRRDHHRPPGRSARPRSAPRATRSRPRRNSPTGSCWSPKSMAKSASTRKSSPAPNAARASRNSSRARFRSTAPTARARPATAWAACGNSIPTRSSSTPRGPPLDGAFAPTLMTHPIERGLERAAKTAGIALSKPFDDLPEASQEFLLFGEGKNGAEPPLRHEVQRNSGADRAASKSGTKAKTTTATTTGRRASNRPFRVRRARERGCVRKAWRCKLAGLSIAEFAALPVGRSLEAAETLSADASAKSRSPAASSRKSRSASVFYRSRPRLPEPRPLGGHAVGRRIAARAARHADRHAVARRPLCPR